MGGTTGLAPEQRIALDRVATLAEARSLYLAGGSAVAFHLAHRRSADLDLFSTTAELDLDAVRRALLSVFPDLTVRASSDVTLKVVAADAALDVVRYPYPPLEAPGAGPGGFPVAGLRDLAVMKLAAIANRGIRRDFWDLFVVARSGLPLAGMLPDYVLKFGRRESDLYHVFRSLTYFADAEADPLYPAGMTVELWAEIRGFFEREVPGLVR